MCNSQGRGDENKEQTRADSFTLFNQTWGVGREESGGGRVSHPPKLPSEQSDYVDGLIASCHGSQSSWPLTGTPVGTNINFILYYQLGKKIQKAPRNILHKNGGPSGKLKPSICFY